MHKDNNIAIIGTGAWGAAIASQLCKKNTLVLAYTIEEQICEQINNLHTHPGLSSIKLPSNLRATLNIDDLSNARYLVIAVPSKALMSVLEQISSSLLNKSTRLIIATKGLDEDGILFSEKISEMYSCHFGFLGGPNLALEVASNTKTTTMIAAKEYTIASEIAQVMSTDTFSAFPTQDLVAIQIAGAVKNVGAILAGALDGIPSYGDNTKSWMFTLALQDISNITYMLSKESLTNIHQNNVLNPGVVGDLALGFYSKNSRNNAFGKLLVETPIKERQAFLNSYPTLVEGVRNCRILNLLAQKHRLNTSIVSTLYKILEDPERLEAYIAQLF